MLSKGTLDAAVDSLIEEVKGEVLGKRKLRTMQLDANESIIVDGRVEISCDTLNQLRHGRWLNNWMLTAGIQMSDKPYYVRYGESVALDERDPYGDGIRQIDNPLSRWRNHVESQTQHGQKILIHFCPLNIEANHFTLLEINEREGKIFHYDSMADRDVIEGRIEQTRVEKIVQVNIGP
jgi:Ulp1 protease family, C-terminal catalytic domain